MANILSDIQGVLSNWYRDKTQMAMSGGEGFGNEWEDYQGFEPRVTPNSSLENAVNQPGSWNTEPVHRAPNSWFSPEGMAENTIPGGFLYNAPGEESQLPIFPGMAQSYLNTQRHMSDPYYKTTAKEDLANIGNLNVPVVSDIADVGNLGWMAKDFIGDPSAEEAMAMGMMPFIGMARGKHITPHRWTPEPVTDAKGMQKMNPNGTPAEAYNFDFTFGGKGQGAAIHGKGEYGLQSQTVEDHYFDEFSRHPEVTKRIEKGFVPKPDVFEVSHPDQAVNQMLNQDLTMAEQNPHILDLIAANPPVVDLPGGKKEMFETGKASPLITNASGKSFDDLVPQSGAIPSTASDEYMEAQIMESFTQDYNTQVEMAKELGNDPSLIDKREIIENQLVFIEEMLTEELADSNKRDPGKLTRASIDEYGDLTDQLRSLRKLDIDSFKFPEQTAPSDVVTPEQILARYGETEGHEFRNDLNRFFDPDDPRDSGPTQTKDYLDSIGIPGSFTYEGGLRGGWGDYGDLKTGDEAPKIFVSHNPDAAYHYAYKGEDPFDQEKFDNLLKQEEKYKKMTDEHGYPPWTRYKK